MAQELTLGKFWKALSEKIVVRLRLDAGTVTYPLEIDMPRAFSMSQLPSFHDRPIPDLSIFCQIEGADSGEKFLGELGFWSIDKRGRGQFHLSKWPMKTRAERAKVRDHLKRLKCTGESVLSPKPTYADWCFTAHFTQVLNNEYQRYSIPTTCSNPHCLIVFSYALGRLHEYMERTNDYAWVSMENRLRGFIRAQMREMTS